MSETVATLAQRFTNSVISTLQRRIKQLHFLMVMPINGVNRAEIVVGLSGGRIGSMVNLSENISYEIELGNV